MRNEGYCKITLDSRGKKQVNFGKKWGQMPRKKANARFLRTGNGLVVIDLDQRIIPKKLKKLLGKPTVRTARGWHWYIRTDKRLKTMKGIDKGLDIRAEGGLVFTDYWGDEEGISYERVGKVIKDKKVVKKLIKKYPSIVPSEQTEEHTEGELVDEAAVTPRREVKKMLSVLGPEYYDDHDAWLKVGMALKSWGIESGKVEAAWRLFDKWSRQSKGHYNERANRRRWESFDANGITLGTLAMMAKEEGYEPPKESVRRACLIHVSEFMDTVCDAVKINAYLENSAFERQRQRIVRLTASGYYNEYVKADVAVAFGDVIKDDIDVTKAAAEWFGKDADIEKVLKDEFKKLYARMLSYLVEYRQFDTVRYIVDPWAEREYIEVDRSEGVLRIITNRGVMKPREGLIEEDPAVLNDYRDFFGGELDDFIDLLGAMRFASDRKQAYLWLQAPSDWGKSFLFQGVLKELGLVTVMSESELKLAVKGSPSGLSIGDFSRAWFVVFEEFRSAVAELKNITHTLQFAPKNKAKVEVDVYGKIMLSAEDVPSLVGDAGGEEQFIKRISHMEMDGSLTSRELFRADRLHYRLSLTASMYRMLKERWDEYVAMGRFAAARKADAILERFHDKHLLAQGQTLQDGVEDRLHLYFQWIDDPMDPSRPNGFNGEEIWQRDEHGKWVSYRTAEVIKAHFIKWMFGEREAASLMKKSLRHLIPSIKRTTKRTEKNRFDVYKFIDA